jgi:hypothetical protein
MNNFDKSGYMAKGPYIFFNYECIWQKTHDMEDQQQWLEQQKNY